MNGVVAFIRRCVAAGMDYETALLAAEQLEALPQAPTAGALRQRRYRERHQASQVTESDASDACDAPSPQKTFQPNLLPTSLDQNPTPSPPIIPPALAKPNGFARFWEAYPNKVGKRAAETAYAKALKRADAEAILAGLERAKDSRAWDDGFIPHPTTWLNQDRWDDQPAEQARPPPNYSPSQLQAASDELAFRMAKDELARRNNERNPGVVVPLPEARQIGRR